MKKYLGKIDSIEFGLCGYKEAEIGLSVCLTGTELGGVNYTNGFWDKNIIEHGEKNHKWSINDRIREYSEIVSYISDLLNAAKVKKLSDLVNVPIEATFDGNTLKSWHILTEAI